MKLSTVIVRSSGGVRVVRVQAWTILSSVEVDRDVHVVHVVRSSVSTSWWDCMPHRASQRMCMCGVNILCFGNRVMEGASFE